MLITFCPYEGTLGIRREKLLKLIKDAGFDGVEIQFGVSYGESMIDDYDIRDWQDLKSQLENLGLASPTVMTPPFWPLTHPAYKELAQGLMRHYIRAAEFFGAKVVGTWPTAPTGISKEEALDVMRQNLLAVIAEAKDKNIRLALEFEPYDRTVLVDYKEAMTFIKRTDEELKIIYDTTHVYNLRGDPYKEVIELGDLINMIHFSESDRLPPGKGKFNFRDFYRALKEIKYDGSVDIVFSCKDTKQIKESREFIYKLEKEISQ